MKPWTSTEVASLIRMRRRRMTNRHIASALDRSYRSVIAKVQGLGLHRRGRVKFVRATVPRNVTRVTVPQSDVIAFYECGWRFVGFDHDLCVFEWQAGGTPRWPNRAPDAVRELEAA